MRRWLGWDSKKPKLCFLTKNLTPTLLKVTLISYTPHRVGPQRFQTAAHSAQPPLDYCAVSSLWHMSSSFPGNGLPSFEITEVRFFWIVTLHWNTLYTLTLVLFISTTRRGVGCCLRLRNLPKKLFHGLGKSKVETPSRKQNLSEFLLEHFASSVSDWDPRESPQMYWD